MKISEISISRPVLAIVMSLAILLFGIVSFTRLPVREYPDIDPPVVSITTFYRGASPNIVETEITDVLEEQLSTVEGVKTLRSSSQEQGSVITVEFELGRDVDEASNDVRDRVSRVRGLLPREAEDPVVEKVDVNAFPIIWLALFSTRHSALEITDVADRILKERIQRLPGVAGVMLGGERRYAMRVWLDPQRMAAYQLTPADIERAIRTENTEIPGGRVEGGGREFSVRVRGDMTTAEEFANLVVLKGADYSVRLADVARVEVGAEDERTEIRYQGQPAMGVGVIKQKQASTLDVGQVVEDALPELRKLLADGMKLEVAYNSATFIEESIDEVIDTLFIAIILVIVVILLFLKSFRATIIPALAIPTSIIGAFAYTYFMGYTINILTLLALVLSIGLVVDDAIVMLENIYRHMQMGKSRLRASIDGAREIGFAILATTITLVAVFIPLAFLQGNVGRLFNEFGASVAIAVLISGFIALTLTPMLCSRILKPLYGGSRNKFSAGFDNFFASLDRNYNRVLNAAMRQRTLVIGSALGLVILTLVVFKFLPSELVPTEDRDFALGIVLAPEGATLEYTDRYMRQIEQMILNRPEVEASFAAIGLAFAGPGRVTDGIVFVKLKPRDERDKSQQEFVSEMFPQLFSIPGVFAFMINPPSLGSDFGSSPIQYVLQGDTYEELQQATGIMMGKAFELGYLLNPDTDLRLNKPQLDITIDRERAAQLGISVEDIGTAIETMLGGRVVTDYKRAGKQYDVIVQTLPSERATPDAINQMYVRGNAGLVQLATVVAIRESVGPKELNHFNRVRSATISAGIAPGVSLGQALEDLDRIAEENLPPGIRRELAGQSREFRDSSGALYFMFLLAVIFIFLVLAAQFESFVHPMTILLSVPLAIAGALISLLIFGQTLNIFSQIGLIMLIGLVTKNAILIVEYANQLRERGKEIVEAVIEASRIRLRPILMTSFATVFGILPIAIGLGAGAESRRPLGIAVVGGLIFSTFLTLILVPVVYSLLAKYTTSKPEAAESEVSDEVLERAESPTVRS